MLKVDSATASEPPKVYERYKDSGIPWLGKIPDHWSTLKAKFVWRETDGRSTDGLEQLLSVSQYGGVVPRNSDSRSESLVDYKLVEENDLVINIMLAWLGGLGVASSTGVVSPAYCVYRQIDGGAPYNSKYLHYLTRTQMYLDEFARRSTGVVPSRWRMYTDDFGQVQIITPPLDEQQRIAKFLDQKTAEIDTAIAKKKKLIELLKEQKAIVINQAVTKGLNPNAPMRDSGVEWIGEVPEHWGITKLKYVTRKIVDGAHFTPTYVDEGVPFLRVTDISKGQPEIDLNAVRRIPYSEHRNLLKRASPEFGDVLLSKNGTIGITRVVDWDFEFSFFVSLCLIKTSSSLLPHFFCHFFNSPIVDEQLNYGSKTTSVTNLHLDKIKELLIVLPPINEQRELVVEIEKSVAPLDRAISKTLSSISLLQELKDSFVSDSVTGKVRVY